MNKKLIAVVTSALLVSSVFTGCAGKKTTSGDTSKPIEIGAVLPLTGAISSFGQSSKNAIDLLVEATNKSGGVLGRKLHINYEDDANKPDSSVSALQKLINDTKVTAIIGSVGSACAIPMGPIATQYKIPMITATATNVAVTKGGEYVFRACFIDPFQGQVVAKYATEDLKAKTASILYDVANDYSKGLAEVFKADFIKDGGKVIDYKTYNTGDQDFNAQLTTIKGSNPDVLFLPDYYGTIGLITKQARSLGITSTFLGTDGWDSDKLVEVAGASINGGYFSNHYSPDDTAPEVVSFIKDYKAKYNATPDALAALSYDAAKILFDAIVKAGSTDGAKIKDAMKATNGTFVSGSIKYDADRNPVKAAVMIKMVDGKQTFAKKVNP